MEPLHSMSSAAALSAFDLRGVPPTQISVLGNREHHIYPLAVVDNNSPIVLHVNSSIDEYIKLDSLSINILFSISIERHDKTAISENDWKSVKVTN